MNIFVKRASFLGKPVHLKKKVVLILPHILPVLSIIGGIVQNHPKDNKEMKNCSERITGSVTPPSFLENFDETTNRPTNQSTDIDICFKQLFEN